VKLALDARGEWTAQTRAGVSLRFGQAEPASLAAQLSGTVARSLADHLDAVSYIDLRYPNGFAVGWRGGIAPAGVNLPGAPHVVAAAAPAAVTTEAAR